MTYPHPNHRRRIRTGITALLFVIGLTAALIIFHRTGGSSPADSDVAALSPPGGDGSVGNSAPPGTPSPDGGLDTASTDTDPDADIDTILLLGIDRSANRVGRTDAILIAVVDHTREAIGIISIPRDLWVEIPGLYAARINAVMRIGETKVGKGTGLPLLRQVIEETLRIAVDYTITADFEGFINIIDFLEGIPVKVACPIEDCFHTDDVDGGCDPLVLTAGPHRLDGATALKFVRSRHGRTDIDRGRRQQAVLAGLKKRLTRAAIIPKLPRLYTKLKKYIDTDLDLVAAVRIGLLVATAGRGALHGLVLRTPIVSEATTKDGKQVLLVEPAAARQAISTLFSSPPPGKRKKGAICPAADVGLKWRERLQH